MNRAQLQSLSESAKELAKTEGQKRLEEAKVKLQDTLDFYKNLSATEIPTELLKVTDEAEALTEKFVPKMKQLKYWNQRAMKVSKANESLANYETGVAKELTSGFGAILAHEIHKLVRKFEWIISHIGELALLLAAALGDLDGRYRQDAVREAKALMVSFLTDFDWNKTKAQYQKFNDTVSEALAQFFQSATMGLLASVIETSVASFSVTKFAEMVAPVLKVKSDIETEISEAAWPQGKGRARRLRRHRVR